MFFRLLLKFTGHGIDVYYLNFLIIFLNIGYNYFNMLKKPRNFLAKKSFDKWLIPDEKLSEIFEIGPQASFGPGL